MAKIRKNQRREFWELVKERLTESGLSYYKDETKDHYMYVRPQEGFLQQIDFPDNVNFIYNFGINLSYDVIKFEIYHNNYDELVLLNNSLGEVSDKQLIENKPGHDNCKINVFVDRVNEYVTVEVAVDLIRYVVVDTMAKVYRAYLRMINN